MAYLSNQSSQGLRKLTLVARMGEIAAELTAAYATHREFRQTLAELRGLSDRELSDLGLSRSNLHQMAWETVQTNAESRKPR